MSSFHLQTKLVESSLLEQKSISTTQAAISHLEQLAKQSENQPKDASILCLRIPVALKPTYSFLETLPLAPTAWLCPQSNNSTPLQWNFSALGCALQISARGNSRFDTIQKETNDLFAQITPHGCAKEAADFDLRFFGGASFAPNQVGEMWQLFPAAYFMLPRWLYATKGNMALLQLIIQRDDFIHREKWKEELHRIFKWLNRQESLKMPETESVQITHYSNGWEQLVDSALKNIEQGTLNKVVVSRMSRLVSDHPFSVRRAIQNLENTYPDCTRFVVGIAQDAFIGATPEQLVQVLDRGHVVTADALAGSASHNFAGDDAAAKLLQSEKERREFNFVLSNLEKVFSQHNLVIANTPKIEVKTLKNLHHLHCRLCGHSKTPKRVLELVTKFHPTPAVCGTPTKDAATWLAQHEQQTRGWYAGPVGWFNKHGEGEFVVGIRSALLQQCTAWLFAGAGIVSGSKAAVEFTETGAKLSPMLGALGAT